MSFIEFIQLTKPGKKYIKTPYINNKNTNNIYILEQKIKSLKLCRHANEPKYLERIKSFQEELETIQNEL